MVKRILSLALFFFSSTALFADVSMRQVWQFQMKLPMPGAQQMPAPFNAPAEMSIRVKGDKAYSSFGPTVSITDTTKNQITILDAKGQRYATESLAAYLDLVQKAMNGAAIPDQAKQVLANLTVDVQVTDPGKTERIQGIDTEERDILMTISIPMPVPGQEGGMKVTAKFQCWKPKAGENDRVPALHELESYYSHSKNLSDPGAMMRQMFSSLPGLGPNMEKLADALSQGGQTVLRLHGAFYMPGLVALMAKAKANGADVPDMGSPDSPLLEMQLDVQDINTEPVPASLLQIPAGYTKVPLSDIMKMPAPPAKP